MQDWRTDYPYGVITGLAAGDIGPARRCQYPVGGVGAQTRFCGRRSQPRSSYCARHLKRCVDPAATSRDNAGPVTDITLREIGAD